MARRQVKSNFTKKLVLLALALLTIALTFYACSLKDEGQEEVQKDVAVVNEDEQQRETLETEVVEEEKVVEPKEEEIEEAPYFLETVEVDANGYPLVDNGLPEEPTVIDGVLIASKVFPIVTRLFLNIWLSLCCTICITLNVLSCSIRLKSVCRQRVWVSNICLANFIRCANSAYV